MLSRWKSKDKSDKSKSSSSSTKKKRKGRDNDEDWHNDGSRMDAGGHSDTESRPPRSRSSRRDDPRRHTLAGNHGFPHAYPGGQMQPSDMALQRGYPPANALLFDDDPGIMSEVETASTGFRRGGKQRSSLPVVRTPSKTLERPLGLVYLQYRNETKRGLLPNEITSIDTVKAIFVRSFPYLTMQRLENPHIKIYIHDASRNMFCELQDNRASLREIRDRCILRLSEAADNGFGGFPGPIGIEALGIPPNITGAGPGNWDTEQNYFSEPEIDADYHHHIHKSKIKAPAYYMGSPGPNTLPRGGAMMRAYSPAAPVAADRINSMSIAGPGHREDGYMSSPERVIQRSGYEDPYYSQYITPGQRTSITPVISEEVSEPVIIDETYRYGVTPPITTVPRPMTRPPFDPRVNATQVDEVSRERVEMMERKLDNLTGLVEKALATNANSRPVRAGGQDAARYSSNERPPKLGRDKFQKSVSFEKSVSFSDDPPDLNSPKQHSPQHAERDRLKPAPPPKPVGLVSQQLTLVPQRSFSINVTTEFFNDLRSLQKQSRDLRLETRNLRRSTLNHAVNIRHLISETIVKIGAIAASFCDETADAQLTREEETYRQDMLLLENDLYELEATVERLRGQAANRETRVNMADIERIAMVLSKSSKTVADWKLKFPILQETVKIKLAAEMEKVVRKEKMLEEEPERLEVALRRCKKLTGTLVTLKRLACVQEQRLPLSDGRLSPGSSQSSTFTAGPSSDECPSDNNCHMPSAHNKGTYIWTGNTKNVCNETTNEICESLNSMAENKSENALDMLIDELQVFVKPANPSRNEQTIRRLYTCSSDTNISPPVRPRIQNSQKPPIPERPELRALAALAARRAPPPPPPRTTSRSPLASPQSKSPPAEGNCQQSHQNNCVRQNVLEQRHQELLKKQKALQEQYARLQMIQRTGPTLPTNNPDLKKTGSESDLLMKLQLNLAPAMTGSMTHLAGDDSGAKMIRTEPPFYSDNTLSLIRNSESMATTNKIYETDIL